MLFANNNTISYELYYQPELTPEEDVDAVLKLLEQIKKERSINYKICTDLKDEEIEDILDEIRSAALKGKFRVVSRGGAALAISKTKKLNFLHGPILIVREGRRAINVFPKSDSGSKGSKKTALDFLKNVVSDESSNAAYFSEIDFSEEDLRNLIIKFPGIIEEELEYFDIEIDVGSAVIDLVMKDKKGNHLLLEFKLEVKDATIGQLTRYNIESYSKLYEIPKSKIRRGIVTLSYTGQIIESCKTNKIELYIINSSNLGYTD